MNGGNGGGHWCCWSTFTMQARTRAQSSQFRVLPCLAARDHSAHGQPHVSVRASSDLESGRSGMSQGRRGCSSYVQVRRFGRWIFSERSNKGRSVMAHESRTASARAGRVLGHENGSIRVAYARAVNAPFCIARNARVVALGRRSFVGVTVKFETSGRGSPTWSITWEAFPPLARGSF